MKNREEIVSNCRKLVKAYNDGELGYMEMPEDSNPKLSNEDDELRLVYFTLPMALNYQRDSYKLWDAVLKTYKDPETRFVFDINSSAEVEEDELRGVLLKHKVALQPNKHVNTWKTIASTINDNWGSIKELLVFADYDFLKLRRILQRDFKKGFPYLSGPKIFNYWSFIIQQYCDIKLSNSEFIEIAPDTHVTKCSVKLGVISEEESESISKEELSLRWREILKGSGINPIDMHSPLWFWSRNNFQFIL